MRKLALTLAFSLIGGVAMADDPWTGVTTGEWQLLAQNGAPVVAETTFAMDAGGKIAGKAACNRYFGANQTALPGLQLGQMGATRMFCDKQAEEDAYLAALSKVSAWELRDGHMILTGEGVTLEFVRDRGDKALTCLTCNG